MPPTTVARNQGTPEKSGLESAIHDYGKRILSSLDAAEPPSLFSKKGFYASLMD